HEWRFRTRGAARSADHRRDDVRDSFAPLGRCRAVFAHELGDQRRRTGGGATHAPARNAVTEKWVLLTTVYTCLDAHTIRATMEEEGIAVLGRGCRGGVWGRGFQGPISEGAEVLVRESALARARELMPSESPTDDASDGLSDDYADDGSDEP